MNGSILPTEKQEVAIIRAHNPGDISFEVTATALLFLVIPGCGFFYSGMAENAKGSLSLVLTSLWAVAIVSLQWYVIGYSLAFSETSSLFVGNLDRAFLRGIYESTHEE